MTMKLENIVSAMKKPLELYKNNRYVNLNANVLAAAYPSIKVASLASDSMSSQGCTEGGIVCGAAIVDWLAYIPIHIGLHYLSKRHQFEDKKGNLDKKSFWKDVSRVYLTQLPSIALFYAMAGPLHYELMELGMKADNANMLSYWGTLIATRALHTYNYYRTQKSIKSI